MSEIANTITVPNPAKDGAPVSTGGSGGLTAADYQTIWNGTNTAAAAQTTATTALTTAWTGTSSAAAAQATANSAQTTAATALTTAWTGTSTANAAVPLSGSGTMTGNLHTPALITGSGSVATSSAVNGTVFYDLTGVGFQQTTVDQTTIVSAKNITPGAEIAIQLISNGTPKAIYYDSTFSWFGTQIPFTSATSGKKILVALGSYGSTASTVIGATQSQL